MNDKEKKKRLAELNDLLLEKALGGQSLAQYVDSTPTNDFGAKPLPGIIMAACLREISEKQSFLEGETLTYNGQEIALDYDEVIEPKLAERYAELTIPDEKGCRHLPWFVYNTLWKERFGKYETPEHQKDWDEGGYLFEEKKAFQLKYFSEE